jgi:hypothetical protein
MSDLTEHPRYDDEHLKATPGCGCDYCSAVFDDWGQAADGFQRWYEGLTPERALRFFGEVRG